MGRDDSTPKPKRPRKTVYADHTAFCEGLAEHIEAYRKSKESEGS